MTRDLRALALKVSAIGMLFGLGVDGAQAQSMWTAQAYPRPPAPIEMMPPHEVRTIVRSTGLTPAGPPVRRGDLYIQPALDPYGRPMRVVVDADAGAVVSIRPAPALGAGPHPSGPYPRYGALPPREFDDDDDVLPPPRPIPNVRAPLSGERTATRNPPTTPVPRPRPVTAPRDPAVAAVKPTAPAKAVPEAKPEAPAAAAPAPRDPAVAAAKPVPDPTPTASIPQQTAPEAPAATAPAAAPPEAAAPAETNAFPPVQPLE